MKDGFEEDARRMRDVRADTRRRRGRRRRRRRRAPVRFCFSDDRTDGRTDVVRRDAGETAPNRDRSRGNVDDSLVSAKRRRNEEEGDRGDGDDEIRRRSSGTTSGCGERRRARLNSNRRDGGQDERKRGEDERQVDAGEADAAEEAERRRGLDAVLAGWRTRNAETRRGFGSGGTDEEDGG